MGTSYLADLRRSKVIWGILLKGRWKPVNSSWGNIPGSEGEASKLAVRWLRILTETQHPHRHLAGSLEKRAL